MEEWKPGDIVRLEDGGVGTLQNPRGCFCGPKGEECWDIGVPEGGGIQAHGGTFHRSDEKRPESENS